MAENSVVTKMLEISNAHISEETSNWLDNEINNENSVLVVYQKLQYGWFISLPEDLVDGEVDYITVPEDLIRIIEFAKSENCTWVMLDRDAMTILELPIFDW
ncbi:hypothetical protein [Cytobacillus praedii]|uniref:DUF5983 family protein n=1 Tax=Cytobacillus praedii TaxID=1742358 RepID=UPI002E24D3C7|nr:hypothetical protein [Cytobacillus praedii]